MKKAATLSRFLGKNFWIRKFGKASLFRHDRDLPASALVREPGQTPGEIFQNLTPGYRVIAQPSGYSGCSLPAWTSQGSALPGRDLSWNRPRKFRIPMPRIFGVRRPALNSTWFFSFGTRYDPGVNGGSFSRFDIDSTRQALDLWGHLDGDAELNGWRLAGWNRLIAYRVARSAQCNRSRL
ncbi:hypothetical protein LARV_00497 [Longilinea arvoryzae]|uniref:Uncharacterized protein n=1 Tax=Longilinea arvoryzae TaxID=360412 RepID=A0A0S7BC75_9CHLR|nr:hypothetical protein LARV_00497 [Longilinea arvoryzae]